MYNFPESLQVLIEALQNLPGVGKKTAERYAFNVLTWDEQKQHTLSSILESIANNISTCSTCGCLQEKNICSECSEQKKDPHSLLIVAYPKEVYSLKHLHIFNGYFHVLGGLLSPLDGIDPDTLNIASLKKRVEMLETKEIVFALDTTLEGEATTLYLKQELACFDIKLTQLAHGLPSGSPLDYVDESTLHQAFAGRHSF